MFQQNFTNVKEKSLRLLFVCLPRRARGSNPKVNINKRSRRHNDCNVNVTHFPLPLPADVSSLVSPTVMHFAVVAATGNQKVVQRLRHFHNIFFFHFDTFHFLTVLLLLSHKNEVGFFF